MPRCTFRSFIETIHSCSTVRLLRVFFFAEDYFVITLAREIDKPVTIFDELVHAVTRRAWALQPLQNGFQALLQLRCFLRGRRAVRSRPNQASQLPFCVAIFPGDLWADGEAIFIC